MGSRLYYRWKGPVCPTLCPHKHTSHLPPGRSTTLGPKSKEQNPPAAANWANTPHPTTTTTTAGLSRELFTGRLEPKQKCSPTPGLSNTPPFSSVIPQGEVAASGLGWGGHNGGTRTGKLQASRLATRAAHCRSAAQ